ncbi:MAG: cytochrome P450, partial [Candidatus Eremiobacteraeota bacterium]|nr:cytochrome P450 [Candidatus Eremiobacteraeota bacterium]
MLHVLDAMLDSPVGKPKRLTTPHGTTLIIRDPGQAAAILNDKRFIRIDFLSLVFGPGIVFSEDKTDSTRRDVLRKQFGGKLVSRFLQNAQRVFLEAKERWKSQDSREYDLSVESNRLTLDIFCRSALDCPIGTHFESLSQALTRGVQTMGTLASLSVGESVALSPTFNKELEKVKTVFNQFAQMLIQKRRKRDTQSDFLLDALCQSELSDQEISDELTNLLLAGGDTSSLALTWALICLRDKPAARARIKTEAENFLGPEPDAAGLAKLEYTTAVVEETLRLFPPVWH